MKNHGKKIKFNMISGLVSQVIIIGFGFLLPRLYLVNFGSEVNGILSTIKQIFTYLTLLEAGVGLATTQALYKPIASGEHDRMNAILSATKSYYLRTGVIYSSLVFVIAVVYSFVVKTSLSSLTIFLLVILNALPSLFSYFVQAKYRLLMEADGRKYIITNSETVLQIATNVAKILVLVLTSNLVLMQATYCALSVLQLAYVYLRAKKMYPWLKFSVKPDFDAIGQKNSVLIHQISGMVFNNTDILLLSFFSGFEVVSVYAIYNMFFVNVQNLITNIASGTHFALGQSLAEDKENFKKYYQAYETVYIMVTFIIFTLMSVFLLALIQIYTGGVEDISYIMPSLMLLFVISNLLSNGKLPANQLIELAGEFKNTRSHAIIEMTINLVTTVVGIHFLGIYGALLGTIAALLFRSIVAIYHANHVVLERSVFATYKIWLINGVIFAGIYMIFKTDYFCGLSFLKLLLMGVVHTLWIVPLYIVINVALQRDAFRTLMGMLRKEKKQ